jgi:multidrug efflux pump subunit AcrB
MERKKRRWLLGCVLVIAVFGMAALAAVAWRMGERSKPEPVVEVMTFCPGMSASGIEQTITNRIERWINQAHGVSTITSRSLAGVSIVRVSFRNDIDLDAALAQVNQLVLGTLSTLPPDTLPPVVLPRYPRASEPLGMLGVSSATAEDAVLQELAYARIRYRLLSVPGAVAPFVLGGRKDHPVVINLDPKKMTTRKVLPKDVGTAVEVLCGKVRIHADKNEMFIQANFQFLKTEELNLLDELRIRAQDGEMVRLGDLGVVQDQSPPPTVRLRIDGGPVVGVPVYLQRDAPLQEVSQKLTAALPSLREEMEQREAHLRWVPLGIDHKWLRAQDDGLLKIYLRAPSNARLPNTEKRVVAFEGFLEKSIPGKEREAIISEIGMTPDWAAAFTANAGPMDATIFVQLSSARSLSAAVYASKLRRLLRDETNFADLDIRFASHDMPAPVDIRIEGGSREEAMSLAQEIRKQLTAIKGTADVDIAQRMDAPQLILSADRKKAAALGLSSRGILSQVVAALKSPAPLDSDFWTDVKIGTQSLTVPYSEDPDVKLEDILNAAVAGGNAEEPVKLSSLVSLKRTTTAVEDRDRSDVIADIRRMLKELSVPEGMRVNLMD